MVNDQMVNNLIFDIM